MNTRTSDCLRAGESVMNNVLARCSHLFPSLREVWYAIPLRLIVGYGFMEHGYAKLARGPDDFAGILHALGMPAPILLSWTTVIVELLGGLAVFVGAFLPLASVPMAFVLLVATFTVHLPNGFSSIKLQSVTADGAHFGQPGYETDLLYLAGLAALVLGGSGPLALDRYFVRHSSEMTRRSDQIARTVKCRPENKPQ
jgi:putative oxidoreductase